MVVAGKRLAVRTCFVVVDMVDTVVVVGRMIVAEVDIVAVADRLAVVAGIVADS